MPGNGFLGGLIAIDAGDLHDRVQIERDTITRVKGVEVRTPFIYATRWANVDFLSGSEIWKAQQVNPDVNVRITMRYCTDLLPSDRIIHDGKKLEIKSITPEQQRKTQIVLECKTT